MTKHSHEQTRIRTETRNGVGLITLDRPEALNALSLAMFRDLRRTLADWAADPGVRAAVIQGGGGRAFCAGGDIRSIYDAHLAGDHDFIRVLFRDEYTADYQIAAFPKPVVALMDGIVMGGGCGISVHAPHRIVTENTVLAMPENAIGYFPDVGAAHFLSKCPGRLGLYLGLTGARLQAADILYAGLADVFVPAATIETMVAELTAGAPIADVLAAHRSDPGPSALEGQRPEIDACFEAGSLADLLSRVHRARGSWAEQARQALTKSSPFSLEISYKLLSNNNNITARDSLITDYRISWRLIERTDFYEGIRAVLVDKDNAPVWRPSRIEDVNAEEVTACFAPLGENDLVLPPPAP